MILQLRKHVYVLAALLSVTTAGPVVAAERVVTLAPHLAELVCAAAGCDVLVAVGAYSDYPPEVRRLPVVGDVSQVNLEAVLALKPTRVITWDGGTPLAQLAMLKAVHLPVTVLKIEHLRDVAEALESLGEVLGTPKQAAAAAARYRQGLAALADAHQAQKKVRVLYQIETSPVYSINHRSPISEAITLCGGVNVFADLPTLAASVSDEAVLLARPQVVVHGPEDAKAIQAYWSRFSQTAVQPRLVAINPDLLARSGPRLVQGVEQLCAALDEVRRTSP